MEKTLYRLVLIVDGNYQIHRRTGEAAGDYPDQWSIIGTADNIFEGKELAAEYEERVRHAERVKSTLPVEFEV